MLFTDISNMFFHSGDIVFLASVSTSLNLFAMVHLPNFCNETAM